MAADNFKNVRVPGPNDNVYKDECLYSFDNPESEYGLYICMSTFRGVGKDQLDRHCKANPGKNVFFVNSLTLFEAVSSALKILYICASVDARRSCN